MESPILSMSCIRYYRDGRHWDEERFLLPRWEDVETSVRRMDNYCFPIVYLNTTHYDDDESIFNIIGGDGRWTLFHMMGEWHYTDQKYQGEIIDVRLWESDQGCFCKSNNILTDVEKVLRIVRKYYDTGSYADLDSVL